MVGVAGLVGAGRTEMLATIFGVTPANGGEILVCGQSLKSRGCQDAIAAGIGMVPEDRKQQGLILEIGTRPNIGLPGLNRHKLAGAFLNRTQEKADSDRMMQAMKVKTPSDTQPMLYLSGGNQQKVVIGKWLSMQPRLLLMDEPTRGVDVGAKQEIYRLMEELVEQGVAILFVSSELEEVLSMSDRVLVMHEGKLTGELSRDEFSEEAIMRLATGARQVSTKEKVGL
jgi:ribose transport system ATP-binding protein